MKQIIFSGLIALSVAGTNTASAAPAAVADITQTAANSAQINPVPESMSVPLATDKSMHQTADASELLLEKLQALQEEMQVLRGRLEVTAHDLKLLNTQQRALYDDLDQRVSAVSKKNDELNKAAQSNALEQTFNAQAVTMTDQQAYEAAYELIKTKQYPLAEASFKSFIEAFPHSNYVANAHYWLGELHLSQGELDESIKHFTVVVNDYPQSNKVPAARLKLGFAYYDKGLWDQARSQLTTLNKRFPASSSAKLALTRLAEMKKQGL